MVELLGTGTGSPTPSPIFDYEVYKERGVINNRFQKIEDISKGSYGYVSLATDLKEQNLVAIKYIFKLEESDDDDGDYDSEDSDEYKYNKYIKNNNGKDKEKEKEKEKSVDRRSRINSNVRSKLSNNICFEALHEVDILTKIGAEGYKHNIIKLVDFFDSYIVMEYCMGGDLYENIKSDIVPRSTKMITHLALQLINAVEFVHSKKIYHRDIKPENILISDVRNWTIKLTDWGLATTDKTSFDRDIGSERYMSPELFESNLDKSELDTPYECSKVDLWAIGIVLLNTVFHKNPFVVANQTDKAFCYFAANREALFDVFALLTPEFFQVLLFSLAIDPQHRDLERMKFELKDIKQYTFDDDIYNEQEKDMFKHVKVPGFEEPPTTTTTATTTTENATQSQDGVATGKDMFSKREISSSIGKSMLLTPQSSTTKKHMGLGHQKKDHNVIHYETQPLNIKRKTFNIDKNKRKPLAIPTPNSHINKFFDDYKNKKQENTFVTRDFFTPPSVKNKYIEGIFDANNSKYFNNSNNTGNQMSNKKNKIWTPSPNTAEKIHAGRRYSNTGSAYGGSFSGSFGKSFNTHDYSNLSHKPAAEEDPSALLNTTTYHEYHHLKQQQQQQQQQQQGQHSPHTASLHASHPDEEVLFTLEEDELDNLNEDFTQFQIDTELEQSHTNRSIPELLKSPTGATHATPAISTMANNPFGTSLAVPSSAFKERKNSVGNVVSNVANNSYGHGSHFVNSSFSGSLAAGFNGNRTPRSSFNDNSMKSGSFFNKRPSSGQSGFSSFNKKPPKLSSSSSYFHDTAPSGYSQSLTNAATMHMKDHTYSNNSSDPSLNKRVSFSSNNHNSGFLSKNGSFKEPSGQFLRQLGGHATSTVEKSDVFAKRRQSSTVNNSTHFFHARDALNSHRGNNTRDHDVLIFSDEEEEYPTNQTVSISRRKSSNRLSSRSGTRGSSTRSINKDVDSIRRRSIQDDLVGSLEQYKNNWVMLQQQQE